MAIAAKKPGQSTLYKIIQTVCIIGLFIAVGILVVGIINKTMSSGTFLALLIISIICLTGILSLSWIRRLELKEYKILSIVILSLLGVSCILWVLDSIFAVALYKHASIIATSQAVFFLNFIRISLVLTFQVIETHLIAWGILRYKKTYLPFQIIMYFSNLFVDFWMTCLFLAIGFNTTDGIVLRTGITKFLFTPTMITMFVLFIVYSIISNSVIKTVEDRKNGVVRTRNSRRGRGLLGSMFEDSLTRDDEIEAIEAQQESPEVEETQTNKLSGAEKKLAKLKDMYEKNLITEEEYNKKKEKILEDM